MKQRPKNVTDKLAIQFFPEGGTLVKGISSRVAFKSSKVEKKVMLFLKVPFIRKTGKRRRKLKPYMTEWEYSLIHPKKTGSSKSCL